MPGLICDPRELERLIQQRRDTGADRYDEVWEDLYVMSPLATPEHQWLLTKLATIFDSVIEETGRGRVHAGVNVTDREDDWTTNYRCPDVAVVLNESRARCRDIGPAFLGGPDFLVEVHSPEDKSFEKVDFYGSIGVRELLIIHRDTRAIRFYRLEAGRLVDVAASGGWFESAGLRLRFRRLTDSTLEVETTRPPIRKWVIAP